MPEVLTALGIEDRRWSALNLNVFFNLISDIYLSQSSNDE